MFVRKKDFESAERVNARAYKELRDGYWELHRAHARLLAHLGLDEVTLPEKTVLRTKGGPELGE